MPGRPAPRRGRRRTRRGRTGPDPAPPDRPGRSRSRLPEVELLVARTDLCPAPGTGASGGPGAGLAALGARLLPRFDALLDHLGLDARPARADLVVTAEGVLDRRTPRGKVPAEAARRAKPSGRPVLALAGTLGGGAHAVPGVDAFHGVLPAPIPLAEALARGAGLLTDATERALRMIVLGTRLYSPAVPAVRRAVPGGTRVPGQATGAQAEVSGTQRPSTVR